MGIKERRNEEKTEMKRKIMNAAIDKQVQTILRIFIKGLCSEPEMVKVIMHSGINVIFANSSSDEKPKIENSSWMIVSALLVKKLSANTS